MENSGFKSGFVALLGRPNVGKSTLLNALMGNKISIISPIPQTTRHQIRGILNLEGAQIVFVDTPGIHSQKDKLATHLNTIAKRGIEGCDLILYVVDVSRQIGPEEEQLMDIIARQKIKTVMVLNKIDRNMRNFNDYIELWKKKVEGKNDPLVYYMPLSAKTGKNLEALEKILAENIPQGHAFYDTETQTDFPLKFRVADIVREKLFLHLKEEIPHSIAVAVDEIQEKSKVTVIKINVYVKRNSQKRIVIGSGGEVLKAVGKSSREEIEKIVGRKVFIEIWVEVLSDWQEKPRILKELGYWWA